MPTYQYVCTECGGQLEAVQKFTDDALTVHEACGGRLRKVFSPVGIVFKGSGFYKTDSRSSGSPGAPSSPKENGSKDKDSGSKDGSTSSSPSTESSSSSAKSGGDSSSSSSSSSTASSSSSSGSSSSGSSGTKVA